jgi:osmotically-inducible protein OsmY
MKQNYLKVFIMATAAVLLASVSASASETDSRIESSFRESYVSKTYLNKDNVNIQSKDGAVTLTGTVSEESSKALAKETAASLPGVISVDNQLEFKGERPAENSDMRISMQVKSSLLFNRNVSGINTKVFVADGIVTLRGEAGSQAEKDLAGEYAKDIEGVKGLKNEMTIAKVSNASKRTIIERIDDASITSLIRMSLLLHRSTSPFNTGVETINGVVTLSGKATSGAGKDMATKIASDVNGVTNVVNKMIIEETAPKN